MSQATPEGAPTPAQIALAFAACRSIKFACDNASRHAGDFNLGDIYAADTLARAALDPNAAAAEAKKGGAS